MQCWGGVGPREVLHATKTKTIRKWELNTNDDFINLRTEDFFWGHVIVSYIYTANKILSKYIEKDMCSVLLHVL